MPAGENLPRGGYWLLFPDNYRQASVESIAQWLTQGYSGSVIGGSGSGKSNLCGFIYSKPHLLIEQMAGDADDYLFCYFDVNSLPGINTGFFYAKMLQILEMSLAEVEPALIDALKEQIPQAGTANDVLTMSHSLDQIHKLIIRRTGRTIVWLIDRFDEACKHLDVGALNNLRWLRDQSRFADADQFRAKLAFVVFSRQPLERLRDRNEITDFIEIIEDHTTWVRPMSAADTAWNINQIAQRAGAEISPPVAAFITNLSGGLTSFTKMITESFLDGMLKMTMADEEWLETILNLPACRRICQEILDELDPSERIAIEAVSRNQLDCTSPALTYLQKIGYVTRDAQDNYAVVSPVLAHFVTQNRLPRANRFSADPESGTLYFNDQSVTEYFTALEAAMLRYLLENASLLCRREDLEDVLWPNDFRDDNVGNRQQGLATLVKQLRQKIRELTNDERDFIVTIRGQGFRFEQ